MKLRFIRNTIGVLVLLSILSHKNDCHAQYYEVTLNEKTQRSEIIVEAEVIESTPYENGGRIFTCHKLEVLNWIYPKISSCTDTSKTGCLYVLTNGGRFNERTENWAHSIKLHVESKGLFFLSRTSKPILYTDLPSFEVYSGYQGFIRYTLNDQANFHGSEIFNEYQNPETELIDYIYEVLQDSTTKPSFIRSEWELYFYLHNFQIINTTISFDVSIKAKWGNRFKIKDISTSLKYDTSIFGNNPLTNGNMSFTLDSVLLQDGVSLSASQLFTDEVKLDFTDASTSNGNYIGDSYQNLINVQVDLQTLNINELPFLEFALDANDQILVNESLQEITPTNVKIEIDYKDIDLSRLFGSIESIEPSDVAAGVQENSSQVFDATSYAGIITINGSGFGDLDEANLSDHIPSDNRVEFDATGIGIAANLKVTPFASDYLQWDDDVIKVRVPGIGYLIQNGNLISEPIFGASATSGDVSVVAPSVEFVQEDALTVHFVHWNDFRGTNLLEHESVRLRLKALDDYDDEVTGNPHNNDGVEFFFTQSFLSNMPSNSDQAVKEALEEFTCRTRVNFDIVNEVDVEVMGFAGRIDYGTVEEGVIADSWEIINNGLLSCTSTNPVEDTPIIGHGIVFSNSNDVNFATNGTEVPDVESVALHEFGHNAVLGHVDLNNYVMHPEVLDIDTDLAGGDISGGQHVVKVSGIDVICQVNGNNISFPGMHPIGPCTNSINEIKSVQNRASIFPNPSTSNLIISSEKVSIKSVRILDSTGKTLFSKNSAVSSQIVELTPELPQGVYLLMIQFNDGVVITQKIIIL